MLRRFSRRAVFVFPGRISFSGEYHGREAIAEWFELFEPLHLTFALHDMALSGPPWKMNLFIRFTARQLADDGTVTHENSGVIHDRVRWGKIVYHECTEDTQRLSEFEALRAAS